MVRLKNLTRMPILKLRFNNFEEISCMPAESPSILIVDDEEAVLTICKHLLQKMGYNVIEAKNSGDAYQIANKNRGTIAVAILDYSLPSMENENVAKRLSEIDSALKIMLTSGYCEFGPFPTLSRRVTTSLFKNL